LKKLIIPLIICLFLCGCFTKNEIPVCVKNVSFDLYISYYNEKFCFNVKTDDSFNSTVIKVKSPEDLKDMEFTISEKGTVVNYMGLTYVPNKNSTVGSIVEVFCEILKNVSNKNAVCKDNNYVIETQIDGNNCCIYFSPAGYPLYFEVKDINFKGEFRNLTLVK